MSIYSSATSNYGGRQPNNTSYIKQFSIATTGYAAWVYKIIGNIKYITPVTKDNVFLPKDLFVVGSINSPSDLSLKENIYNLSESFCNNILKIIPKKYNFTNDENKKERYGIIAQELEVLFPELITNTGIEDTDNTIKMIKSVNYLELIPIMIVKMKNMQNQIDELNNCLSQSYEKV
jgi:hypothetical protein